MGNIRNANANPLRRRFICLLTASLLLLDAFVAAASPNHEQAADINPNKAHYHPFAPSESLIGTIRSRRMRRHTRRSLLLSKGEGRQSAPESVGFKNAEPAGTEDWRASEPEPEPEAGPSEQSSPMSQECRAIEERSSPGHNGTCRKASVLPEWCLPMFKDMNGVRLMAEAGHYIRSLKERSLKKTKVSYLINAFRNLPSDGDSAMEKTHWLHNQQNLLGLYSLNHTKPQHQIVTPAEGLPSSDLPSMYNFTTCAVVGSGRMMLAKPRGEEIDAHSVIFRSNQAPTDGYERYVGSRTDIRVVNAGNIYFSEDGPKTSCLVPLLQEDLVHHVMMMVHPSIPDHEDRCQMLLSSPQLEAYRWTTLVSQNTNEKAKAKMSSGFLAIAMAVQLCEKVDIYGYSFHGEYYFPKAHYLKKGSTKASTDDEQKQQQHGHPEVKTPRHEDGDDSDSLQPGAQAAVMQGRRHRRRLQSMAENGHPWDAERTCTGLLDGLPNVRWHQDVYNDEDGGGEDEHRPHRHVAAPNQAARLQDIHAAAGDEALLKL